VPIGKAAGMPDPLATLEQTLLDRRTNRPEGSYSVTLFDDPELVQRKIMEEAFEVCLELGRAGVDADRVASEAADLIFHLLAGLASVQVPVAAVYAELERRR
jgi:phosphoribosyl-ATP pyrophosphohydrolase